MCEEREREREREEKKDKLVTLNIVAMGNS